MTEGRKITDWLCPYCRELNDLDSLRCVCGKSKVVVGHALPYLDFLAADLAPRNKHHAGRRDPRQMSTKESQFYSRYIRPYMVPVGKDVLWCLRCVTVVLPNTDRFVLDFVMADRTGRLHSVIVWGKHSQFHDEVALRERAAKELPVIEHASMAYPFLNIEVWQFVKSNTFEKVFPK